MLSGAVESCLCPSTTSSKVSRRKLNIAADLTACAMSLAISVLRLSFFVPIVQASLVTSPVKDCTAIPISRTASLDMCRGPGWQLFIFIIRIMRDRGSSGGDQLLG